MRLIQIAVASVDPTVGAVRSNVDRMLAMAHEMGEAGVTLGCFSEQVVGGYPPEDLIQWRSYVASQRAELERFARETAALPAVFVAGIAVAVGQAMERWRGLREGEPGIAPVDELTPLPTEYIVRKKRCT